MMIPAESPNTGAAAVGVRKPGYEGIRRVLAGANIMRII
jgi:hypothetical protein